MQDLQDKVKKCDKISENIYIVANDPSLAFYRIQEHVRKVIQPILDKRIEILNLQKNLQGHCFDMEYAVSAIKNIEQSESHFSNIQEMIKTAIFYKRQLKNDDVKSKLEREPSRSSVYKRFSAHLALDLPDLTGVMRGMTSGDDSSGTTTAATQNFTELQRSHTTLH